MTYSQRLKIFPFIFILCEITVYLANDMYLPSMPAIAYELSLSQEQIQNTLTFWFLGASCFQFIVGPLSDRFGRKIMILIGGALFVVTSALCASTYYINVMLWARFVQGASLCFILVAGNSAIHESFSTKEAIKWLALIGAVTILAPALGPLFGAIIVQFASWRYIFWLLVAMGFVSFVLILAFMPETNKNPHPLNFKNIVSGYFNIITNPNFMLPSLGYCFLVGIFFFWMFESPFIYIEYFGKSTMFYGWAQALIFSIFFVGERITKWWLNRHPLSALIRTSIAITASGMLAFLLTSILFDNIYLATICMMLISLGASMLFGPVNRLAIESSTQPMGRRIAVFSTNIGLFGTFSGWLITVITEQSLYAVSVLGTVCAVLASLLILQTKIPKMGFE